MNTEQVGSPSFPSTSNVSDPPKPSNTCVRISPCRRRVFETSTVERSNVVMSSLWKEKRGIGLPSNYKDDVSRGKLGETIQNSSIKEGSSTYNWDLRNRYAAGEKVDGKHIDGLMRVGFLEKDRAELIRMLDELKEQMQQPCNVSDKKKQKSPVIRVANQSNIHSSHDQAAYKSSWDSSEHSPSIKAHGVRISKSDASGQVGNNVHGHRVPITRRAPVPPSACRNLDNYFKKKLESYSSFSYFHKGSDHQPASRRSHCYSKDFSVPFSGSPRVMCAHLQKRVIRKYGRHLPPVVGAAPFTVCTGCYELLELPNRVLLLGRGQIRMRCGSCSQAIVVNLSKNKLDTSAPVSISKTTSKGSTVSEHSARNDMHFPDDNKLIGNNESCEQEMHENLSRSENSDVLSSSSSISFHKQSPNTNDPQCHVREPEDILSVQHGKHSEHSFDNLIDGFVKVNRCTSTEQETNSTENVQVDSETNLLADELPHDQLSQDSFDAAQHNELHRGTKSDSFLSSIMKRSVKHSTSAGNNITRVCVNGYSLSGHTIKKAERKAGPISPGDYWYDYRSGFWGVAGHPCLGVIPPFIEEFNYLMPRNCAGGNTGIFVNGRELHQKDLDLLLDRGLDDTPGRSYRIEISGQVWDEISGEVLYSLGKLAPTVEKMRRGFGMRVPKALASS